MNQAIRVIVTGTAICVLGGIAAAAAEYNSGPNAHAATPAVQPSRRAIRTSITGLFGWKVGIAGDAFPKLSLLEVAQKAKELGVTSVEAFSSEQVSPEIAKALDSTLSPEDIEAIKGKLKDLKVTVAAYRVKSWAVTIRHAVRYLNSQRIWASARS